MASSGCGFYHNDVGPDWRRVATRRTAAPGLNLAETSSATPAWPLPPRPAARRRCRELALGWNDIGDDGARALAAGAAGQGSTGAAAAGAARGHLREPEQHPRQPARPGWRRRAARAARAVPARPRREPARRSTASPRSASRARVRARLTWLNLGGTGIDDGAIDAYIAALSRRAPPRPCRESSRVHDNELSPRRAPRSPRPARVRG